MRISAISLSQPFSPHAVFIFPFNACCYCTLSPNSTLPHRDRRSRRRLHCLAGARRRASHRPRRPICLRQCWINRIRSARANGPRNLAVTARARLQRERSSPNKDHGLLRGVPRASARQDNQSGRRAQNPRAPTGPHDWRRPLCRGAQAGTSLGLGGERRAWSRQRCHGRFWGQDDVVLGRHKARSPPAWNIQRLRCVHRTFPTAADAATAPILHLHQQAQVRAQRDAAAWCCCCTGRRSYVDLGRGNAA